MKKSIFLVLICFVLLACEKQQIRETFEIPMTFELLDDVSPVTAIFKTEEKLFNPILLINSDTFYPFDPEGMEYVFLESGAHEVELKAQGRDFTNYYSKVKVDVPRIANKLIISGFYFKTDYDFVIPDDNIIFDLDYYNGSFFVDHNITITTAEFNSSDSITFENPIVVELPELAKDAENNSFFHFGITGTDTNQRYFKSSFFLKDWYYHDRSYAPNYIYLDNFNGDNNRRIYLNANWLN